MSDGIQILLTAGTGGLAGAVAGIIWQIVREKWDDKRRRERLKDSLLTELSYCLWLIDYNRDVSFPSGHTRLPMQVIPRVLIEGDDTLNLSDHAREQLLEAMQKITMLNAAIDAVHTSMSGSYKPTDAVSKIKAITSDTLVS